MGFGASPASVLVASRWACFGGPPIAMAMRVSSAEAAHWPGYTAPSDWPLSARTWTSHAARGRCGTPTWSGYVLHAGAHQPSAAPDSL